MQINHNPYADKEEDFIFPIIWRDFVATISALADIKNPLDGELRKVISNSLWYQYNKKLSVWGQISKLPADVESAVTLKHIQGTDQKLDAGGVSEVNVAQVKDAVDKKHANTLDHIQNTDTKLDAGGANEVTVANVKSAYIHSQVISGNPHSIDLTDLSTYDHVNLQNLQGGTTDEYYHLTSVQHGVLHSRNLSDKFIVCEVFTSTGINACIDLLGSEGGEVYLPEGTYTIDSTITTDYNYTTLRGAGWGTKLDASGWSTGHVIDLNGKNYLVVRDLQIEGRDGGGNSNNLINGLTTDSLFENLWLHHSDYDGMYLLDNSTRNIVRGCTVNNCDGQGFKFYTDYSRIENNYTTANNCGFYIKNSIYNIIRGNHCYLNRDHGFYIKNSDYSSIMNNIVFASGNNDNDFWLEDNSYCSIIGNVCRGANTYSERGMYLDNCDYCTIVGNSFAAHDTCGIYLDANSSNNHVAWNNLEGEAVAKIIDAGSNNTVINAIANVITNNSIVDYTGTMGNSAKDPTTVAPDDWVEVKIGGTTYYIPAYSAS